MKTLIFGILLITAANSYGQNNTSTNQQDTPIAYSGIVTIDSISKEELFIRARDWLNINSGILNIQDKETGELSANDSIVGNVTIRFLGARTETATFGFLINIWVKDGHYKYVITNIVNTEVNGSRQEENFGTLYNSTHCNVQNVLLSQTKLDEAYQSAKDGFNQEVQLLIKSLKESMTKTSTPIF